MSAASVSSSLQGPRVLPAILVGGFLAGLIDFTYATAFYSFRGVSATRVWQSVASGLLGPDSYKGGLRTAALGVFLHFVIALGAATVFYLASRKLTFMTALPFVSGPLFGVAIYFFMHLVVLPLSANPRFKTAPLIVVSVATVCDFAVHVICLGPAIAFSVRRFSR